MLTDIEVACYGYEGVDAVKASLNIGLDCSTEDMPMKVSVKQVDDKLEQPLLVFQCCSLVLKDYDLTFSFEKDIPTYLRLILMLF